MCDGRKPALASLSWGQTCTTGISAELLLPLKLNVFSVPEKKLFPGLKPPTPRHAVITLYQVALENLGEQNRRQLGCGEFSYDKFSAWMDKKGARVFKLVTELRL